MRAAPLAGLVELVGALGTGGLVLVAVFSAGFIEPAGLLGAGGFAFGAGRFVLMAVRYSFFISCCCVTTSNSSGFLADGRKSPISDSKIKRFTPNKSA